MKRKILIIVGIVMSMGMMFSCGKSAEKTAVEKYCDFVIKAPIDRDFKILQLTDTQVIDSSQCRESWDASFIKENDPKNVEVKLYSHIRKLVEETKPDLITITGDVVYGRFDDRGVQLTKLIEVMESFKISWCPVFGNHDNETKKGVKWQCEQFENAKYCMFKRGTIDYSNGNYTVAIVKGRKPIRILYFMDSNGCAEPSDQSFLDGLTSTVGLTKNHQKWFKKISDNLCEQQKQEKISGFAFFHIPTRDFELAAKSVSPESPYDFDLGNDYSQNWGVMREKSCCSSLLFADYLREVKIEACFVGHDHVNNFAIDYQGVKWVYGLKTGSYDYSPSKLGGLLIEVGETDYTLKPVYTS